MVVYDQTGYYNDGDSIICAAAITPEEPVCRYEARFVAYGGMVYSVSDPDELLAEIIKIDPKSLYGKDSQQVAVDKVIENIVPQAEGVVPIVQTEEEEEVPVVEETATTTPAVINPEPNTNVSTTTPPIIPPPPVTISTTTPWTTATTTPPTGTLPEITQPATTTPPRILFPDPAISTSTPEVSVPEDSSNNNATSSDATGIITNDLDIVVPPLLETPASTDTGTTTDEVVAFAKKLVKNKISKSLGL